MVETTPHLGIDFGAADCVMAWFNPATKEAEILPNAEGRFQTPAAVHYGADGVVRVGAPALELWSSADECSRVIRSVRRDFALPARYPVPGNPTRLDAVVALLSKLKHDAETGHFHCPICRTTIACPATFSVLEQDKLREAAQAAGFKRIALLETPISIARAFVWAGRELGNTVLVYDHRATTLDLALLERSDMQTDYRQAEYRIVMPPQTLALDGDDFDCIERSVRFTRSMVQQAQAAGHSIERLLMIGEASRLPPVQEALREAMPDLTQTWERDNLDCAAALGAVVPFHHTPSRRRTGTNQAQAASQPVALPTARARQQGTPQNQTRSRLHPQLPDHTTGEIARFADHPGPINIVAFAPNGRLVVSGSASRPVVKMGLPDIFSAPLYALPPTSRKMLVVRDLAKDAPICEFTGCHEMVRYAAFSPEGTRIFVLDGHANLQTWDESLNDRYGTWRKTQWTRSGLIRWRKAWGLGDADSVPALHCALSANGDMLLVGAAAPYPARPRCCADLWDARTGEWLISLGTQNAFPYINGLAFSPDGEFAAITYQLSGKGAGNVALCRVAEGTTLQTSKLESVDARRLFIADRVVFSPTGRYLLLYAQWDFILWDVFYWQRVQSFHHPHTAAITSMAFSPDGRHILSTAKDGTIRFWEVYSGKQVWIYHAAQVALNCVSVSPDGRQALFGGDDGVVRLIALPEFA